MAAAGQEGAVQVLMGNHMPIGVAHRQAGGMGRALRWAWRVLLWGHCSYQRDAGPYGTVTPSLHVVAPFGCVVDCLADPCAGAKLACCIDACGMPCKLIHMWAARPPMGLACAGSAMQRAGDAVLLAGCAMQQAGDAVL